MPFLIGLAVILGVVAYRLLKERRSAARQRFIREFHPPPWLFEELCRRHPQLSQEDCAQVANGLRQFFLCYLQSGCRYVSMPSRVVDDLWHGLILDTRAYKHFCQQAFGHFLHHRPAQALSRSTQLADAGLHLCWWQACRQERINPRQPDRVPLLFNLDSQFAIVGGFLYVTDCQGLRHDAGANSDRRVIYCGGDFSSSDNSASDHNSSGDSSDSGSGDSGGGCGGGCGGGGGD